MSRAAPTLRDDGKGLDIVAQKPDAHIPSRRKKPGGHPEDPLL
jgi:hypothetical protein